MPDTLSEMDRVLTVVFEGRQEGPYPQPVRTPKQVLDWMIRRRAVFGTPLPDGYVPPPGIDIEALVKQLPPEPPKRSP